MQSSIFGKPLDDLSYEDVVTFCDSQIKENLGLDYKKDLSSLPSIVKALVSFANTNGGWLIIGVEDDGNDKPKLPITGIDFVTNIDQKIINSIVSTVSPIVLPVIKVCRSTANKVLIVVHMPQSSSTPHFMSYKGKNILFVRVADRAMGEEWERYASSPQWEMLRNKRSTVETRRDQFILKMKEVYETNFDILRDEEIQRQQAEQANQNPRLFNSVEYMPQSIYAGYEYELAQIVSVTPTFPSRPVTDVKDIEQLLKFEPVSNGVYRYHSSTPDCHGNNTKIYQFGAYTTHLTQRTGRPYFFGADIFGNVICIDPIEFEKRAPNSKGENEQINFISIDLLIMHILGTLKFTSNMYRKFGLIGDVTIRVEYDGTKNTLLFPETTGLSFNTDNLPQNILGSYTVQRSVDTTMINNINSRHLLVLDIVKEILNSFNFRDASEDKLDELISHAEGKTNG